MALNPPAVAPSTTERVNGSFTMPLAVRRALCHSSAMTKPDPRAGGFLLSMLIVIGLIVGIVIGSPITGAVIGTAAGILVALIVWAADRGRARR